MKYIPPYGAPGANDPYVNGDPSIARQGSIIPAEAVEHPQREIANFIENSDMIADQLDLQQLTKASRHQWVNFCVDSGAVNALSVALTPVLTAYKQGIPLRVMVANNNTGPSTINVNSLGPRPIKRSGGANLVAGDLLAGMIALLVDDGTNFQMLNYLGASGGSVNNYTIDIPYAEDVSVTPNLITANYTPPLIAAVAGDLVLVKVANVNTGAVTFVANGLAAQPIKRNDGQQLQSKDLIAGECILIEYNTTYWQMLRLVRSQVYFKLTADLILYVRTDGNDTTGDGSLNDAAHAFRTIQAAIEFTKNSFLIAGRTVTIQLGIPGTYQGQILIQQMPGNINIIGGDNSTKLNYIILGPTSAQSSYPSTLIVSGAGSNCTASGVTFSAQVVGNNVIESNSSASVSLYNVAFSGLNVTGSLAASFGGHIIMSQYINVYNQANSFFGGQNGSLVIGLWFTLIQCHPPCGFYQAFVNALYSYVHIQAGWCTFSGVATGTRYLGYYNSAIVTGGGGANYFPGNMPGSVDASSVYG